MYMKMESFSKTGCFKEILFKLQLYLIDINIHKVVIIY